MRIVLLCEGKTERAFKVALKGFLDRHCEEEQHPRVGLDAIELKGPRAWDCERIVDRLEMNAPKSDVLGVVGLVDVYPRFSDAKEAREYLRNCVKNSDLKGRFHAHAAQHDVEAWLLPFWNDICRRLSVSAKMPRANPEDVNNGKPPSKHLAELYSRARRTYEKVIEAPRILKGHQIEEAATKCPELQSLLNTLKVLCNPTAS